MDMQMLTIRPIQPPSIRSLATRSLVLPLVVSVVLAGVVALAAFTAQEASAAGLDTSGGDPAAVQQTVPEPADPQTPAEGGTPGAGTLPEGETAVADGGSATPWVAVGVGVLLVLALAGAFWASRTPRAMDLDGGGDLMADPTSASSRYVPPGF